MHVYLHYYNTVDPYGTCFTLAIHILRNPGYSCGPMFLNTVIVNALC